MKNLPLPTANFSVKRHRDVNVSLESYVDADFASCIDDRHPISGFAFLLAGGPVSWQSRPGSILATIPTRRAWTECVNSNSTEGGQQCLHYFLGSPW